jgi:hypothetical protein
VKGPEQKPEPHQRAEPTPAAKARQISARDGPGSPKNSVLDLQGVIGNQGMLQLLETGAIQARLRVSQPGDPDELEADRIAERVTSGASTIPSIQRKCDCPTGGPCLECEDEDLKGIHRKAKADSPAHATAPADVVKHLGPGRPIDRSDRSFLESRLGHDFSSVRVYAGPEAADSAKAIDARAYTAGNNIVFGEDQFAPGTLSGLQLLAHELVHVIQQGRDKWLLARKADERYETEGIVLDPTKIEPIVGASYWSERVGKVFELSLDPRIFNNADPEERDAVLSALWNIRPTSELRGPITRLISIPKRKTAAASKNVVYKFTLTPRTSKKPLAEVRFVAEDAGAGVKPAGATPSGFTPQQPAMSHTGFPDDKIDKYWKEHPEEHLQVFDWIEHTAPNSFEQIITTSVASTRRKKTVTRQASFHVKGTKDARGNITNLRIDFLGAMVPSEQVPPADYHSKQFIDVSIEDAQSSPDPKKKDKLGAINGIGGLPQDELFVVKYAIWQYFEAGTRSAEVNAIVPIPSTTRRVLYKLRFQAKSNDVDVRRIGEEGKDVSISAPHLSLARVSRFAELENDVPKLKDWVKKRYPSVTPTGNTAKEVCASVDAQIRAHAGTPGWFLANYGIQILAAGPGATRLQNAHPTEFSALQVADMKDFTAAELIALESVLETVSDAIVTELMNLQMARQKIRLEIQGKGKKRKVVPNTKEAGLSLLNGTERTVVIFDRTHLNDAALFLGGHRPGGSLDVSPASAMTSAHELGHIVSWGPNVKDAFDKLVKKEHIQPFTSYAAGSPQKEFFAESFALFQLDPEWLLANSPKIFAFFEALVKTGNPPPP